MTTAIQSTLNHSWSILKMINRYHLWWSMYEGISLQMLLLQATTFHPSLFMHSITHTFIYIYIYVFLLVDSSLLIGCFKENHTPSRRHVEIHCMLRSTFETPYQGRYHTFPPAYSTGDPGGWSGCVRFVPDRGFPNKYATKTIQIMGNVKYENDYGGHN